MKNLRLSVRTDEGLAQILDHVELALPRGQILGVVGEFGCGKSTWRAPSSASCPRPPPSRAARSGWRARTCSALSDRELTRRVRGRRIGFIPQDPYLALNPVFKIGAQLLPRCAGTRPALRTERERRAPSRVAAAPRADPRARGRARALSAPVLRRPAPAPDDRRRARLQPGAGDRRRADHRARRHDAAADPEAAEVAHRRVRLSPCCS